MNLYMNLEKLCFWVMEILMRKKRNSVRRCGGEEDASRFCFLRVFLSACFVSAEKKMRCGGEEDAVRRRRRKGYFVSAAEKMHYAFWVSRFFSPIVRPQEGANNLKR
ncbi:unnamed protein product [Trifolium pratense]|uniref:Uncharacterized protein n=1 Tax=Trifolium pratense TaxID=57577 RepID=A0ACB0JWB7_TRIPR|nr:unnamed protein product [Trifolium pratense]